MAEPWVYVAEKDGRCLGIIVGNEPQKQLAQFYKKHAGCEIKAMPDADATNEYMARTPFGKAPE